MSEPRETKSKKTLPKTLPGTVISEHKRCGKTNCRCAGTDRSRLHGPYFYRYWREAGRLRKEYVPKELLAQTRAACATRQAEWKARLQMRRENAALIAHLNLLLREVEARWRQDGR